MTLEDFFTLSEMKDGLAVPSRVHELVAVMRKEKDCVVKNIGDATRQWAAVASTIAATENKDCLDLFIQLDGLWFIDRWLKDAQNFSNDTNDGFVEESIAALLRALEKLQIDKERSMSSGICITVNNLRDHNCSRIQDRAKALFDGWKEGVFSDKIDEHVQGNGEFPNGELSCQSSRTECTVDFHPAKGSSDGDNNVAEPTIDNTLQPRGSNSLQPEKVEDIPAQPHINKIPSNTILNNKNAEDRSPGPITSVVSISIQEKATWSSSEGNSSIDIENCSVLKPQNAQPKPDSQKQPSSFQGKLGLIASASGKVEAGAISASVDATSAQENAQPTLQNNADTKEGDFCLNPSVFCDGEMSASVPEGGTEDVENAHQFNMRLSKSITEDGLCCPDVLQDLPGTESRSEEPNELGSPLSQMEGTGTADDDREDSDDDDRGLSSDGDEDMRDGSHFSKPAMDCRIPNLIDLKKSDIEIDYGIIDALEVARQVAQEVEREVIDYRELSCSSSEKTMKSGDRQPGSPDSVSEKPELHSAFLPDEMVPRQNQPAESDAVGEGYSINSDNLDTPADNGMQELESSQVTELAKEQDMNAEKGVCDFDLNQEVSSDDVELPVNSIFTPVSVVSASRPAAASGSPAAPLQFKGTLGWKGSAATSAFRPASPRKTSDGDKTFETRSSNTSKQRHDCLDIDLNVAGGGDEEVIGIILEGKRPVSSGLQSGESSLELGPRRSDKPSLDLNRTSDDDTAPPSDLRMEGQLYFPRNGHHSPSPASSSSSMQPPMRNFDLNDRPLFANEFSDQGLHQGKFSQIPSSHGGARPADSVISIMGKRVEVGNGVDVGRKDGIPQMLSLPHGKPLEPAIDANMVRIGNVFGMVPSASYTHSPAFGYNGFTSAPPMSITTAMYGPACSIPYMVDSRGVPVVPQIMGSASAVSAYPQPPFVMNMTGANLGLGGVRSSRPNFDLNSGFAIDGGSVGGLRQFFMPSQGRSLETNSQPSSSSVVDGKRKEPDGGWELYSLHNKHPQGPWR